MIGPDWSGVLSEAVEVVRDGFEVYARKARRVGVQYSRADCAGRHRLI